MANQAPKWNGYRQPRAAGGGALNNYYAPKAKQSWQIGDVVNVGFVRGLEVIKKNGATFALWQPASNRFYSFQPHVGLCRHSSLGEALST